ncbi:MAG TPA: hypothetical protein VIS06_21335, partial [Mycobacteriales bacterium]
YDLATGTLEDVLLTDDPAVVAQYTEVSDELIRRSTPMLDSPVYQTWAGKPRTDGCDRRRSSAAGSDDLVQILLRKPARD